MKAANDEQDWEIVDDGRDVRLKPRGSVGQKRKPFAASFVMLPTFWIEQLEQSNNPGAFKLACRILREKFKRDRVGGEIVLSAKVTGLSRTVRFKAVKELVRLGLIVVEQSGNRTVKVVSVIESPISDS